MPDRAVPGQPEADRETQELQRKQIEENILESKHCTLSPVRHITTDGNDDFPAAVIDTDDNLWIVWSSSKDAADTILARRFSGEDASDVIRISTRSGMEFAPAVSLDPKGRLWFVWSAFRDGEWQILGRRWAEDRLDDEHVLDRSRHGEFRPALYLSSMGWLWLAWERVIGRISHISVQTFDGDKWGGVQIISEPGESCYRPSLAETTKGTVWCAWDEWREGDADIYLRGFTGRAWLAARPITEHAAMDMQPALVGDHAGNMWIAYVSNRSGPKGWHISRWIYVRRFDGTTLYQPAATQIGRDLTKKKEDQGWEFPSLIVDRQGCLWIFGRASHSYYAQSFCGQGWSEMVQLVPHEWGCRGQRIRPVIDAAGDIWIVSRGLESIEVQRLTPRCEGEAPPKLKAVVTSEKKRKLSNVAADKTRNSVEVDGETYNVYFGDMHAQSSHSDAMGEADEFHSRCRHIYKLDFAILTDHEEFCKKCLGAGEWSYLCNTADRLSEPGEFITFCGYEWTGVLHPGPGHMSVVFPGLQRPIHSRSCADSDTVPKLLGKLAEVDAIAVPHHIGWTGFDYENHDPARQPVVEVCSIHGAYEFEGNEPIGYRSDHVVPGYFVRDLLNKGLRFGLCAGSGGHGLLAHHGMGWKDESSLAGLTGVFAESLTRESVMDAIKKRRCYATSGQKIFLDVRVNGHMMGSEIDAEGEIEISVTVVGTYRLRHAELIRDGEVIHTERRRKKHVSFTVTEPAPNGKTSYYYVRVVQGDSEMAWSSPIWVTGPARPEQPEEEEPDQAPEEQSEQDGEDQENNEAENDSED